MATHSSILAWRIPMHRRAWWATVHRVTKSRTRLSDFTHSLTQCTYMESRKMVLKNLFTGQQWRNRHREQTYGLGERGGEGEMYGKSNVETYITIRKIASGNLLLRLRKLKQGL